MAVLITHRRDLTPQSEGTSIENLSLSDLRVLPEVIYTIDTIVFKDDNGEVRILKDRG